MMRYALVAGGVVVTVVESASGPTVNLGGAWLACPDQVGQGHTYDGATWTAPAAQVPQQVTRRQAKQALLLAGKLHLVQPAIDAIADATQRSLVQIEWDDSQVFERSRPTLMALATALGMSAGDLDALFIAAAQLA